jgi:uncharacterized OB-fold protein
MYCPYCGEVDVEKANCCPECGSDLRPWHFLGIAPRIISPTLILSTSPGCYRQQTGNEVSGASVLYIRLKS